MNAADYVELRARSAFSFLRGASLPEELVGRAAALGYQALALTDRGNLCGAPRFHRAMRARGLRPIVGAEVLTEEGPLLCLCESAAGYAHLCRLLTTTAQQEQGVSLSALGDLSEGLLFLVSATSGPLAEPLRRGDDEAAAAVLERLCEVLDPARLRAELQIHGEREQDDANKGLFSLARRYELPLVATNDVRFAAPERLPLHDLLTCVREGVTRAQAGALLLANHERYLKSPAQMAALFAELPEAITGSARLAERCQFTLDALRYRFPAYPLPPEETQEAFLRAVVLEATPARFRLRESTLEDAAWRRRVLGQIDRELALIARLGLSGYFLIVWDIIQFCARRGILVQGRGSAANSAVCFALGISAVDPLRMNLLFERFLSEERDGWPDIDLDLPSGRGREEVIQYLYRKYGATGCGMTSMVITYKTRSAVRDAGKALGLDAGALSRLSAALPRLAAPEAATQEEVLTLAARAAGLDPAAPPVAELLQLAAALRGLPRHLAQHPGGMVIAAGRLDEVVPLQPAAMPGRVQIQWDKDDCADLGLIKIDLLGLGMMAALEEALTLVPRHDGLPLDYAALPEDDPAVYAMLCQADTVGVFQVESRAQMAVLPRVKPRRFYDLVVQVGLIRPGPITGHLVHPYLRRRCGQEPVRYAHPALAPILERTLGVPLFQEQIMRVAMTAAGFSGGQAELLRRAMGRSGDARMAELLAALQEGLAKNGIVGAAAAEITQSIQSFAAYGFPESHAISFALLTYASAYLKAHHPAVFYVTLLNAWPMGFYHPATLLKDAQRRGVEVLPIDVNASEVRCAVVSGATRPARALRLGLRFVRGLRQTSAEALVAGRGGGRYRDLRELRRRCPGLSPRELATLAELGALAGVVGAGEGGGAGRREALWQVSELAAAGELWLQAEPRPEDPAEGEEPAPGGPLREMTLAEAIAADYRTSGVTVLPHPLALHRAALWAAGVREAAVLAPGESGARDGARVRVAGAVIVRQRPPTAKGFLFLTLEDETGLCNAIVTPDLLAAQAALLLGEAALILDGVVQRQGGAVNLRVLGAARLLELADV